MFFIRSCFSVTQLSYHHKIQKVYYWKLLLAKLFILMKEIRNSFILPLSRFPCIILFSILTYQLLLLTNEAPSLPYNLTSGMLRRYAISYDNNLQIQQCQVFRLPSQIVKRCLDVLKSVILTDNTHVARHELKCESFVFQN